MGTDFFDIPSCLTIRCCEELRWYLRINHVAVKAVDFNYGLHLLLPKEKICVSKFLKYIIREKDT